MARWEVQCVPELAPGTFRCGRAVYEEHGEQLEAVMAAGASRFQRIIIDDALPPNVMQAGKDLYDDLERFVAGSRGSDVP